MRITYPLLATALFVLAAAPPNCFGRGAGAMAGGGVGQSPAAATPAADPSGLGGGEAVAPASDEAARPVRVFLILTGGAKVEGEEVAEKPEGFWFRRGNVWTLLDRAKVERVEREAPAKKMVMAAAPKAGPDTRWALSDSARVESFFMKRFGRPLPVTAFGQSGLHTRWGYDHRHSMDIGLHPDSTEGRALMAFLVGEGIPFLGFRSAIPGVASAPHIHIGFPSHRLPSR